MRLADWPRNPYLNDELREWIALHLNALHVEDVAIYAMPRGRDDEGRRVLIATEVGLIDGMYSPRGTSAHYSLQTRLHPWHAVRGVTLLAETYRLWAYEHRTWWRLRVAEPPIDVQTEDRDLGCALADLATACSVMAEPAGRRDSTLAEEDAPPAPGTSDSSTTRGAIAIGPDVPEPEPPASGSLERPAPTSPDRPVSFSPFSDEL